MTDHPPEFFEGTEMPSAGWWEALWPNPRSVLASVGLVADTDVVDLCSGDGWFTLELCRIARRVTAVDIDSKQIETAQIRPAENGVTNCAFVVGDAYDLAKLVGRPTDFVFMANAFH